MPRRFGENNRGKDMAERQSQYKTKKGPADVREEKRQETRLKCLLCDHFLSPFVTSLDDLWTHDELRHHMGHLRYIEVHKRLEGYPEKEWLTSMLDIYDKTPRGEKPNNDGD